MVIRLLFGSKIYDFRIQVPQYHNEQIWRADVQRHVVKVRFVDKDETGKPIAYLRIKDENILATPIHLRVWQQSDSPRGELIRYTEREQLLLDQLEHGTLLSLNRYCRQTGLSLCMFAENIPLPARNKVVRRLQSYIFLLRSVLLRLYTCTDC